MWQLTCKQCDWQTLSDLEDAVLRLRYVGHVRRVSNPDEGLVGELLPTAADQMVCPLCQSRGLAVADADDGLSDDDWQTAVLCEFCRKPIPPERLEFLPDTRRCVQCQNAVESGAAVDGEPEFCPKCGSLVELRVSRGAGITRYKRFCTGVPPCRL
jgi:Zn finger protein HypA/HybF involved in hydrogenase expression